MTRKQTYRAHDVGHKRGNRASALAELQSRRTQSESTRSLMKERLGMATPPIPKCPHCGADKRRTDERHWKCTCGAEDVKFNALGDAMKQEILKALESKKELYRELYSWPGQRNVRYEILDEIDNSPPREYKLDEWAETFSEELNMGFGKSKFTPEFENLSSFRSFQAYQVRALAHFMGVERQVMKAADNAAGRADELWRICQDNDASKAKAKQGYDSIIRGRGGAPQSGGPVTNEAEIRRIANEIYEEDVADRVEKHVDKVDWRGQAKLALKEAAEQYRPIAIKEPGGKVRKIKGVLPPEFERMVQLASQRIPIMLVGPAGCGKTYLCEKLGEALDMEFSDQSCSEGMSESVFNGLLLPIGAGGAFKHVPSPFMERYENGGVMLLDEIDAGDPNLFTYINKAIANSSYTVAQRYTKPKVAKHKDFVLVAAANTFGHGADAMYVGRNQLDAATLDRFKVGLITMDYSREVELSLADKSLCEWAWKVRDNIRKHKLRRIMSTRVIRDMGLMFGAYNWNQKDWENSYFTGWTENERRMALEGV